MSGNFHLVRSRYCKYSKILLKYWWFLKVFITGETKITASKNKKGQRRNWHTAKCSVAQFSIFFTIELRLILTSRINQGQIQICQSKVNKRLCVRNSNISSICHQIWNNNVVSPKIAQSLTFKKHVKVMSCSTAFVKTSMVDSFNGPQDGEKWRIYLKQFLLRL